MTMRNASGDFLTFAYAAKLSLGGAWLWVPFALGLLWLVPRFPIEPGRILSSVFVLMAAALVVVTARAVMIYSLNPWMHWYDVQPQFLALEYRLGQRELGHGVGRVAETQRKPAAQARGKGGREAKLDAADVAQSALGLAPHGLAVLLCGWAALQTAHPDRAPHAQGDQRHAQ